MSIARLTAASVVALALAAAGPAPAEAACAPPVLLRPVVRPLRPVARLIRAAARRDRPHPVLRGIRRLLVGPLLP